MKQWHKQLGAFLLTGLILGGTTFDLFRGLRGYGHSEILKGLSISGVGFAFSIWVVFIFIVVLSFDSVWLLLFIVWLIKKKLHIKSDDNTIYLP